MAKISAQLGILQSTEFDRSLGVAQLLEHTTAVFIKVATSTLHLGLVTRSKIAFRSCDTAFSSCD